MKRLPRIPAYDDLPLTALEKRTPAFNPNFERALLLGAALCLATFVALAAIIAHQTDYAGGVSELARMPQAARALSPAPAQPGQLNGGGESASWPVASAVALFPGANGVNATRASTPIVRAR